MWFIASNFFKIRNIFNWEINERGYNPPGHNQVYTVAVKMNEFSPYTWIDEHGQLMKFLLLKSAHFILKNDVLFWMKFSGLLIL